MCYVTSSHPSFLGTRTSMLITVVTARKFHISLSFQMIFLLSTTRLSRNRISQNWKRVSGREISKLKRHTQKFFLGNSSEQKEFLSAPWSSSISWKEGESVCFPLSAFLAVFCQTYFLLKAYFSLLHIFYWAHINIISRWKKEDSKH